jgi:hypothetical protein
MGVSAGGRCLGHTTCSGFILSYHHRLDRTCGVQSAWMPRDGSLLGQGETDLPSAKI